MRDFEIHITIRPEYKDRVDSLATELGYKTSLIDEDEVMGRDKLCYITFHTSSYKLAKERLESVIESIGVPVLRKKIEHILYDAKV